MTYTDQLHLQRHKQYERKFSVSFQRVLKANYYQIARNLEDGRNLDEIDSTGMQRVYTRLYLYIMNQEGPLIWNELVTPLTGEKISTKDIFDELASTFAPDKISEMKGFWKGLMTGYLNTYIIQRVTEVMGTTLRRVNESIERLRLGDFSKSDLERFKEWGWTDSKILELRGRGLSNSEIARYIRTDARVRELRANTIARTEATNAMSKSQILALESSGLNWDKSWNAIRDDRTREDHWITDPTNWIGIKDNFIIGGFPMAYPGDSTQGSPLKETINCRCRLAFRLAGRSFGFRPIRRRT